ncbi:uncharacterized protein LOC106877426 [Octopus bimaculoides]|uniref:uncharacterized protein LOC106877426 n=1 Tax=Octopus bimaculoides TaxID=37653 RepID=UPI00071DC16A|nr:uncharacterized protein LOC106877426 [Octopus bimaculoides]|eukprot:XP_014781813.1 PREDICTED: uncharacterized protein LOC106877426 [Octopus bimaculoides]
MVERFHRQLKAALRASPNPQSWTEFLPVVLLGCRTAVKADLGFSAAELLYGTTLALSGTMLIPDKSQPPNPASYVTRLRDYFSNLPTMSPRQQSPPSKVPSDIDSWSHVFARDDSVRGPLVSPYKGPFRVLSRTPKFFKIDANGRTETVSVDRLKKAYFDTTTSSVDNTDIPPFQPLHTPLSSPSPTHTPVKTSPSLLRTTTSEPYVTRSGRTVHWPKKLSNTISI